MASILTRKLDIETYLIFSTIMSVFLLVRIMHVGVDIFAGYPVVVLNTLILLAMGRLVIHPNHAIVIVAVAGTSLIASCFSPTPVTSVMAQISGILLMSVYYFSALMTSGPTVPRWMEHYANIAFYLAVYGIIENVTRHVLHYDPGGEQRLKSIFAEPSLFIYTTLPAMGYYINAWASERRYGSETLIFLLSYAMADSTLGFLGLLLIVGFTYIKRLTIWHLLFVVLVGGLLVAGLLLISQNFRLRATDTALAVSNLSVKHTNASTFAVLSNIYVAANALIDHPMLGVGIGGFGKAYDFYILDLGEEDLKGANVGLNKDDANSLFMRVIAELGPAGLFALIGFLVVCARVKGKPYRQVRNALLPYMVVRMSRFGAYFSMELYFFVGLYLLNYLEYRHTLPSAAPLGRASPIPR